MGARVANVPKSGVPCLEGAKMTPFEYATRASSMALLEAHATFAALIFQ
jgi:hypothetical protein